MTRTAFLAALEQLLAPLPESERKDALSYYEDYLDAAGPENEARAIAELGSPEEVARKILDEQIPAGSSAAPASPAPRSRWRMVLGGGLAVLVLACDWLFFYYMPGYSGAWNRFLWFVLPSAVLSIPVSLPIYWAARKISIEFKIDNGVV